MGLAITFFFFFLGITQMIISLDISEGCDVEFYNICWGGLCILILKHMNSS